MRSGVWVAALVALGALAVSSGPVRAAILWSQTFTTADLNLGSYGGPQGYVGANLPVDVPTPNSQAYVEFELHNVGYTDPTNIEIDFPRYHTLYEYWTGTSFDWNDYWFPTDYCGFDLCLHPVGGDRFDGILNGTTSIDDVPDCQSGTTYICYLDGSGREGMLNANYVISGPNAFLRVTISDLPFASSIPEPMTWALELTGLFCLGATLRRTRPVARSQTAHPPQ